MFLFKKFFQPLVASTTYNNNTLKNNKWAKIEKKGRKYLNSLQFIEQFFFNLNPHWNKELHSIITCVKSKSCLFILLDKYINDNVRCRELHRESIHFKPKSVVEQSNIN